MNDEQLLRYSRQIMLPQVDFGGQEKLLGSRMLIIGAGGLGSPAAMYLAAAGIGHLVIVDHDNVELSNLQRQLLHHTRDIGRNKAQSAHDTLAEVNPDITVTAIPAKLAGEQLDAETIAADVVLDCSDNFATRFEINQACVQHRTPLVSGAAVRFEGQLSVFDSRDENSPCYRCLYQEGNELDGTCSENGVLSPVVGIIGAMQALEALKLVLSMGTGLSGRLLLFDGLALDWRTLNLARDPACPVCR
ncbi:MAG: molybdopterin-synthase adenylyltransferase MoeB [Gammaproteobacteria bacterium]